MYRMTTTHSMLGFEKCKWLRAGMPALIPLFEAEPRLHTVIEIFDKNPSNFQI